MTEPLAKASLLQSLLGNLLFAAIPPARLPDGVKQVDLQLDAVSAVDDVADINRLPSIVDDDAVVGAPNGIMRSAISGLALPITNVWCVSRSAISLRESIIDNAAVLMNCFGSRS